MAQLTINATIEISGVALSITAKGARAEIATLGDYAAAVLTQEVNDLYGGETWTPSTTGAGKIKLDVSYRDNARVLTFAVKDVVVQGGLRSVPAACGKAVAAALKEILGEKKAAVQPVPVTAAQGTDHQPSDQSHKPKKQVKD